MLAERFYADAVTLHPVIVENNWSVLGGNVSELIREVKKVVDHVAYKLPVGEDTSPRALLANAFEELAKTVTERGVHPKVPGAGCSVSGAGNEAERPPHSDSGALHG